MNVWILIGSLLLAVSLYPIWHFVEIAEKDRAANARYEVKEIHDQTETSLNGHVIKLKDHIPQGQYDEHDRREAPVQIIIDGKDFSISTNVTIRPKLNDANRYFGWVSIKHLIERETRRVLLAVVQRIGDPLKNKVTDLTSISFRILYVQNDGKISEDLFSYAERNNPPHRAALLGFVNPVVVQHFPNILVPILVPGTSGLLGFIFIAIGVRKGREIRSEI